MRLRISPLALCRLFLMRRGGGEERRRVERGVRRLLAHEPDRTEGDEEQNQRTANIYHDAGDGALGQDQGSQHREEDLLGSRL